MEELRERIKVSTQGRIVLPEKIREHLGIKEGSILEVYVIKDKIVMEILAK